MNLKFKREPGILYLRNILGYIALRLRSHKLAWARATRSEFVNFEAIFSSIASRPRRWHGSAHWPQDFLLLSAHCVLVRSMEQGSSQCSPALCQDGEGGDSSYQHCLIIATSGLTKRSSPGHLMLCVPLRGGFIGIVVPCVGLRH